MATFATPPRDFFNFYDIKKAPTLAEACVCYTLLSFLDKPSAAYSVSVAVDMEACRSEVFQRDGIGS